MSRHLLMGLLVAVLVVLGACTPVEAPPTAVVANNKVLLVAQERSEDMELMLTREVGVMVSMLEEAGYDPVVASVSGEPIVAGEASLTPDLKLADVSVDDYVGFLFPCMAVPIDAQTSPDEAVEVAKQAVALGKPVAAQVGGVITLGKAGALDGKEFGLWDPMADQVPNGIPKGAGVIQDGNIITSGACPYLAENFGLVDGTSELTQKFIDAISFGS